ncbi:hypothetical protein GCM10027403_20160 [Arthrobacter tecti]
MTAEAQLWITIVGAIAAGSLALLGSWLGSHLGKKTEHEQWLRNEKRAVYSNALKQVHRLVLLLQEHERTPIPSKRWDETFTETMEEADLGVIASAKVREAYQDFIDATIDAVASENPNTLPAEYYHKKRRHLREVMRADLGIESGSFR